MARREAEAAREHLADVQRAANCLTTTIVVRSRKTDLDPADAFRLGSGAPVRVGAKGLSIGARWRATAAYRSLTRTWVAEIVAYQFSLFTGEGREFLAFHWHPSGGSHMTAPHAHVSEAAGTHPRLLDRAHIPTLALSFPDVVRFAITDLGVEPRRDDWDAVLSSSPT